MMFNNPYFTDQQNTSKASQSSVKGRPSVQEVLDKYDSISTFPQLARNSVGQGVRFTFQKPPGGNVGNVGNSPDRGTFGGNNLPGYRLSQVTKNPDVPRDSNQQLLKSIDESNLSKVLSEFSILSEAQEMPAQSNPVFYNPLGQHMNHPTSPRGTLTQKNMQERVTFGEGFQHQFIVQQQQPQQDHRGFQTVSIHDETQKSYMGEDDLFEDMSMLRDKVLGLLQAYSNDIKDTKNVKEVKQKVQKDAQVIAVEYSQIVDRVNQTDISALTNLSFESQMNPKKEKELNMMFNLVEEFLGKFDTTRDNPLNYSRRIEKKVVPQPQMQQIPQPQQQLDLTVLPSFPACDDTFYQHAQINDDKLLAKLTKLKQLLMHELDQANLPYTKTILSDMIQGLNEILTANDAQTVKTVVYRIEMSIKDLKLEDQGSVKLYNYMAKAIKATNKRLSNTEPQSNKSLKRKFFDMALKVKNTLPPDNPKKQIMVSLLFDEYVEQGIPESQLESFISQKLTA